VKKPLDGAKLVARGIVFALPTLVLCLLYQLFWPLWHLRRRLDEETPQAKAAKVAFAIAWLMTLLATAKVASAIAWLMTLLATAVSCNPVWFQVLLGLTAGVLLIQYWIAPRQKAKDLRPAAAALFLLATATGFIVCLVVLAGFSWLLWGAGGAVVAVAGTTLFAATIGEVAWDVFFVRHETGEGDD